MIEISDRNSQKYLVEIQIYRDFCQFYIGITLWLIDIDPEN
jgi:hypothetical protein